MQAVTGRTGSLIEVLDRLVEALDRIGRFAGLGRLAWNNFDRMFVGTSADRLGVLGRWVGLGRMFVGRSAGTPGLLGRSVGLGKIAPELGRMLQELGTAHTDLP